MPYILPQHRQSAQTFPHTPGELNYAITVLLKRYLDAEGFYDSPTYRILNDCLGALEGAKLEFTRRIVNPFEDGKLAQNGDVYHT
jgi:hypothetical protein